MTVDLSDYIAGIVNNDQDEIDGIYVHDREEKYTVKLSKCLFSMKIVENARKLSL